MPVSHGDVPDDDAERDATTHYKVAAGTVVVVLVIITLMLLIVLEVRWIKYPTDALQGIRAINASRAASIA